MNKVTSLKSIGAEILSGDTIALGGGGLVRKPMALVEELIRSEITDLTVVSVLGGPDVDLLLGAGRIKKLIYAYVGFDFLGLAPNFRRAREEKKVEFVECSEYISMAALEAAARGISFMPVRSGLGSDLPAINSNLREFVSPFDGQKLIAVKAIQPDVALLHVNYADPTGYGQILGDRFLDPLYARAARKTIISAERIVDTKQIEAHCFDTAILKIWTTKVVEAPGGSGFTSCYPDRPVDLPALQNYLDQSGAPDRSKAARAAASNGP
jgi:acyl CoA:acetate/3-ketoacid CoA transferase alpha subunit